MVLLTCKLCYLTRTSQVFSSVANVICFQRLYEFVVIMISKHDLCIKDLKVDPLKSISGFKLSSTEDESLVHEKVEYILFFGFCDVNCFVTSL